MAAAALILPATAVVIILLLTPAGCYTVTSFQPLVNNFHTSTGTGNYLVGDEDIQSEFMMESHMSRILEEAQTFETSATSNATQPAVGDCERPPRYDSCLGEKRSTPPPEHCGTFNRKNPC